MNRAPMPEPAIQYQGRPIPPSRTSGIEFYVLLILLFVLYSRVFDFFPVPLVPMFTFIISLAAVVFSGRVTLLFRPRISKLWIALTIWIAVAAAMSIWRIGSFQTFQSWLKTLSVYFVTIGLITTLDQCYRAARTLAWAIGTLAVLCFVYGDSSTGRFFLEAGKFQGPNELAQVLLLGLPLLWLVLLRTPRISVMRVGIGVLLLVLLSVLLRTASRGAMVTAGVMALVAVAGKPSKTKIIAVVGGVLVLVIGSLALSDAARSRYLTFFDASVDQGDSKQTAAMEEIASASADQRWELLLESLRMTAEHPLAGVGPGMFAEARERDARTQSTHVPFLVTHNTYTEFSTEEGIPAAVLFIMIIVASYRTASRIERQMAKQPIKRMREVAQLAAALKFSILSFAVSSIFISVAYQSFVETLAGLVVALEFSVAAELAAQASSRQQPLRAKVRPASHAITPFTSEVRSRRNIPTGVRIFGKTT